MAECWPPYSRRTQTPGAGLSLLSDNVKTLALLDSGSTERDLWPLLHVPFGPLYECIPGNMREKMILMIKITEILIKFEIIRQKAFFKQKF